MEFQAHHTAIARSQPSKPTQLLWATLALDLGTRILDYGCGYGADVEWLKSRGYDVVGYDSHAFFGFAARPAGCFDVVLMIYVVNIIPSPTDRKAAVREAWSFVNPGGWLYVVSRTRSQIAREARAGHWSPIRDGYISSTTRHTFQKGHDKEDLAALVSSLEECHILSLPLKASADFSYVLVQRSPVNLR